MELITDRKQSDVDSATSKGAYTAIDLNRVETAVGELSEILTALPDEIKNYAAAHGVSWDVFFGFPYQTEDIVVETKTDWGVSDIPNADDMGRYLSNVVALRNALEYATDDLPQSMEALTWRGANAIEKALVGLDAAIGELRDIRKDQIDRTASVFVPSGVFYGGSVIYIARPKQTDDETTAVLGLAVLGKMILGNGG